MTMLDENGKRIVFKPKKNPEPKFIKKKTKKLNTVKE